MAKILLFLFFCYLLFCNQCVFYALLSCLLFVYFGCAGSVGIFWRAGSYTFSLGDSAVWSARPVQFYSGILCWSGWRDCTDFSFSPALFVTGTVEMVGGVVRFFLLSFVCCQFSWWLDVCGRIFVIYILILFGKFVVIRAVLCFESY